MSDAEQQLAALLNALPGRDNARFWRELKEAAGLSRIRSTMVAAVHKAQGGDFEPLAAFALEVFNRDAQHNSITQALSSHLGSTLRARVWITDTIAAADRIHRARAGDPLDGLAAKW